jgi:hypothetical protein
MQNEKLKIEDREEETFGRAFRRGRETCAEHGSRTWMPERMRGMKLRCHFGSRTKKGRGSGKSRGPFATVPLSGFRRSSDKYSLSISMRSILVLIFCINNVSHQQ